MALMALHPGATGYELHRVMERSTGYLLRASYSQIYPALRKLHEAGLAACDVEPIKNRPGKKSYRLTVEGEAELQSWLRSPIDFAPDLMSFNLRIVFGPLMPKPVLLHHIDAAVFYLEGVIAGIDPDQGGRDAFAYGFVDPEAVNMEKLDLVWPFVQNRFRDEHAFHLQCLKGWRKTIEAEFE